MKTWVKLAWNLLIIVQLGLIILGFFYFETSLILKVLILLLMLIGILCLRPTPEILLYLILYLGLYDLYNVRYGLAIPLAIIIAIVFGLSCLIFYQESRFRQFLKELDKNLLLLFMTSIGLIILEIFLTMTFWPVDPKIKSLAIVIVFYVLTRVFYFYVNNVLNLKKIIILLGISFLILGSALIFNFLIGF